MKVLKIILILLLAFLILFLGVFCVYWFDLDAALLKKMSKE